MQNSNKNKSPIAFAFEDSAVRIIPDADRPLFVAKDVAVALEYSDSVNAIKQFCDGVPIRYPIADRLGRAQEVRLIDEPDVYRLIFGSQLEGAKKFQDWVFEEVLPSIRKTGEYSMTDNSKIRKQELHLKLLQSLEKATNPQVRESIHASLTAVSNELGFPVIALEDFNWGHLPPEMRANAVEACTRFWAAVDLLNKEENINVNHSNYDKHIAVNLVEVIRLAKEYEIDCPSRPDLLRYLRYSDQPVYQQMKSVSSRWKKKTVKCWVFETN